MHRKLLFMIILCFVICGISAAEELQFMQTIQIEGTVQQSAGGGVSMPCKDFPLVIALVKSPDTMTQSYDPTAIKFIKTISTDSNGFFSYWYTVEEPKDPNTALGYLIVLPQNPQNIDMEKLDKFELVKATVDPDILVKNGNSPIAVFSLWDIWNKPPESSLTKARLEWVAKVSSISLNTSPDALKQDSELMDTDAIIDRHHVRVLPDAKIPYPGTYSETHMQNKLKLALCNEEVFRHIEKNPSALSFFKNTNDPLYEKNDGTLIIDYHATTGSFTMPIVLDFPYEITKLKFRVVSDGFSYLRSDDPHNNRGCPLLKYKGYRPSPSLISSKYDIKVYPSSSGNNKPSDIEVIIIPTKPINIDCDSGGQLPIGVIFLDYSIDTSGYSDGYGTTCSFSIYNGAYEWSVDKNEHPLIDYNRALFTYDYLKGDCNRDKVIDNKDFELADTIANLYRTGGTISQHPGVKILPDLICDMDGDGSVTNSDASRVNDIAKQNCQSQITIITPDDLPGESESDGSFIPEEQGKAFPGNEGMGSQVRSFSIIELIVSLPQTVMSVFEIPTAEAPGPGDKAMEHKDMVVIQQQDSVTIEDSSDHVVLLPEEIVEDPKVITVDEAFGQIVLVQQVDETDANGYTIKSPDKVPRDGGASVAVMVTTPAVVANNVDIVSPFDRPCGYGSQRCGGICTDVVNNRNNCGKCGNTCGPDEVCSQGWCTGVVVCPTYTGTNIVKCGGVCVDLLTDRNNCGSCGTVCPMDLSCAYGHCGGGGGTIL